MDKRKARRLLQAEQERLTDLRDSLASHGLSAESEQDRLAELSMTDQHPADVGSETFERTKELSILERLEGQLVDVEQALHRVDDGSYGKCAACGKKIPEERLEALPAARFCVEDQAKAEREARVAGAEAQAAGLGG